MNDETITLLDHEKVIYKQNTKYSTLALMTK